MAEHSVPHAPDTRNLWNDESWGSLAGGLAAKLLWIVVVGALLFVGLTAIMMND